jgi:4-hydroxy-tetrahydrodipicolinate reductase
MVEKGGARAPYRVVQWATGMVGKASLRAVIQHPRMQLVGVRVFSEAKAGRDAGELCGLGPTGVAATRSIDEIIALEPDCVLYMQDGCNFDDVCRLLESGCNIVTTRGEFHNPARMQPAIRERVETACRRGGSSIHSTGSSPGFITEALPLVLTSIQRRLDCLTIDEFADMISAVSPEMLFEVCGYGETPEVFAKRPTAERDECFVHSLGVVAEALSIPVDDVQVKIEVAVARNPIPVGDRQIAPGTVAGQRITTSLMRDGRPILRFRANWYCTTDLEPAWDLRATGWRVLVEGDAPMDVSIGLPLPPQDSPVYTANRPVNAVPYVCEAPPGIVTTVDLPQVIAELG